MSTKTEITKILFRRGEDANRRQLYTTYGGLDVGEPGFTASDRLQPNVLSATGYTVISGLHTPDATTVTRAAVNGGVASVPGANLWMGCQQGEDIFIGGQSSELYNQSRFVPLKGTDLAWPEPYMDGKLTIGASSAGHDTRFYASGASLSGQYMEWDASCAVLNLSSTTALQIPVGTRADRPGNGLGVNPGCLSALGMIRYNTEDKIFEGLGEGPAWSSLGGARSKDGHTYITTEVPTAPDGCSQIETSDRLAGANADHPDAGLQVALGGDDHIMFITGCEYAGKIDPNGNLYVRGRVYSGDDNLDIRAGTIKAGVDITRPGGVLTFSGFGIDSVTRTSAGKFTIKTSGEAFTKSPIVSVNGSGKTGFTLKHQQPALGSVGPVGGGAFTALSPKNAEISILQPETYYRGEAKDGDSYWGFRYGDEGGAAAELRFDVNTAAIAGLSATNPGTSDVAPALSGLCDDDGSPTQFYLQGTGTTDVLNGCYVYKNTLGTWWLFNYGAGPAGAWYFSTQYGDLITGAGTPNALGLEDCWIKMGITGDVTGALPADASTIMATITDTSSNITVTDATCLSGFNFLPSVTEWRIHMLAV